MQPRQSVSFPSSLDEAPVRPAAAVGVVTGARLVFAAWAAAVYVAYWLGYLGLLR